MSFSLFTSFMSKGLDFMSNAQMAQASRDSARAQMSALENEKNWNIDVMARNAEFIKSRSMLQSWGAGINPMTGSTAAIIAQNESVLAGEIGHTAQEYDRRIHNLEAQSKQKFLGLF